MGIPSKLTAGARAWLDERRFRNAKLPREVRVGVFGSGKAGKFHLRALSRIEGATPVCLVNRGGSDAAPLARRFGIPRTFSSVEQALAECPLDAAIVAVSSRATARVAGALLGKGIPCLVEKPIAMNLSDAAALRDLAGDDPRPHAVAYNRRHHASTLEALRWTRELGSPYAIHVDCPEDALRFSRAGEKKGVEALLLENATHAIDLFTLFGGAFETVTTGPRGKTLAGQPVDHTALITFRNGRTGTFVSHWRSPGDRSAVLYGTDYRIAINLTRNTAELRIGKKSQRAPARVEDALFKPGIYLQDAGYLTAVADGSPLPAPFASIDDGYETVRLACALGGI